MPIMSPVIRARMDHRKMLMLEHRMTFLGNEYGDLEKIMERMTKMNNVSNDRVDALSKKMDRVIEKQEDVNDLMSVVCRRYVIRYDNGNYIYVMKGNPDISFTITSEESDKGFRHANCGNGHICK